MLRRQQDMELKELVACHGGMGKISSRDVLVDQDSELGVRFMHDDLIEPGATVGEHIHDDGEEIYFVVEGKGTIILDGREYPIEAGDVSLVRRGHSHGLKNSPYASMRLIVIGLTRPK